MEVKEDRIFEPYYTALVCKKFTENTGCQISRKQKIKFTEFLKQWTEDNLNKMLEVNDE